MNIITPEAVLDARMSCPEKARMLSTGWIRREVEIGEMTRRHVDRGAAEILADAVPDAVIGRTVAEFLREASHRPYANLPPMADQYGVWLGQAALLEAALWVVAKNIPILSPHALPIVLRAHGTWTGEQARDLRFNLHLQGRLAQANLLSLIYIPLVIGRRGAEGQDSPLTRCWFNAGTGQAAWAHEWTDAAGDHRLGAQWKKWYLPQEQVRDWIDRFQRVQPQAGDPLSVILRERFEIKRDDKLVALWEEIRADDEPQTFRHWSQCTLPGQRCPFIEHCWDDGDDSKIVKIKELLP